MFVTVIWVETQSAFFKFEMLAAVLNPPTYPPPNPPIYMSFLGRSFPSLEACGPQPWLYCTLGFSYTQHQLFCLSVKVGVGGICVGKPADGSKGGVHREVSLNLISWALCPELWEAELAGKCLL